MDALILNGSNLTMQGFEDVVYHRRPVHIDESRRQLLVKSRQVLFDMAAGMTVIIFFRYIYEVFKFGFGAKALQEEKRLANMK